MIFFPCTRLCRTHLLAYHDFLLFQPELNIKHEKELTIVDETSLDNYVHPEKLDQSRESDTSCSSVVILQDLQNLKHKQNSSNRGAEKKSESRTSRRLANKVQQSSRFKCSKCSKSYSLKKILDQHVKGIHQGKIKCEDCKILFSSRSTLRRHMTNNRCRVKRGEIPKESIVDKHVSFDPTTGKRVRIDFH